ncbi:Tyrosine-protein kinase transmembrane receptor Ror [Holothuria leucospilota]|uniref:receptor protein-tyrosine kinase n=1 Tax=Holothuria leucospilota TaxID=206669 RepID=A0A9Q1CDT0_HOLLE|nr:Tyrosine-protein kinase transmembrane receptor Ror [Holothuria leucospilota]
MKGLDVSIVIIVFLMTNCKSEHVVRTQPGSNVSLPCNFSSYQNMSSAANFIWQFNNIVIFSGQFKPISRGLVNVKVHISEDSVSYLQIDNISTSNQGTYTCTVEKIVVATYLLQFKEIEYFSFEKTVDLGTTVSLTCRGQGTHIWSFNDTTILNWDSDEDQYNFHPEFVNNTFSQLHIANISWVNNGIVTCIALGVAEYRYYLRVQGIHLHLTINGHNISTSPYLLSGTRYNVTCVVSKEVGEHDRTIMLKSFSRTKMIPPVDYLIDTTNGSNKATAIDSVFFPSSLQAVFLCTILDDFGNDIGKAKTVMDVVVVPTLVFQMDGKNISDKYKAYIGEILILKCLAFGSRPPVELRWKKENGNNLTYSDTTMIPNEFISSTYNNEIQIKLMAKESVAMTCYSNGPMKSHQSHRLEATIFIEVNSEESLKLLLMVSVCGVSAFAILLLIIALVKLRSQRERRENAELLALSLWRETTSSSLKSDPRKSVKSFRISGNVSRMERTTDSGFTSTESGISCQTVTLVSPLHCGDRIDYWLGRYSSNDEDTDCICETVSEKAVMKDGYNFLSLAKSLRCLPNHTNVVSFLGSSTDEVPYYIYREYVTNNTLRDYLTQNSHANESSEDSKDSPTSVFTDKKYQRKMLSTDVASAMEFLHNHQFHHPALSARKVVLSNSLIPKLFDIWPEELSASRATSLMKSSDPPTAWLPPETIFLDKYEKSSDVWAYGVLLWELFSSGLIPYQFKQSKEIEDEIRDMKLLPQPNHCSRASFDIMLSTWNKNPELRPSFAELQHQIRSLPESFFETEDEK